MAAGADESTEQVVLELPSVRYNKRNGMLLLTSRRIAWAEELSPEYKITHQFCEIKSIKIYSIRFLFITHYIPDFQHHSNISVLIAQKISSEQSNKVQLQLVLHNGTSIKFQFLGETNTRDRNKVIIASYE